MVAIGMGYEDQRDVAHSQRPQSRKHDSASGIESFPCLGADIDQDRDISLLNDRTVALAHRQKGDLRAFSGDEQSCHRADTEGQEDAQTPLKPA